MFDYTTDIPIYALATARAPSALAVTRTSGKNSITLLSKAFSSPGRLIAAADKSLLHGYLRDDDGSDIDEVVLAVYREGSGYTGEEAVESIVEAVDGNRDRFIYEASDLIYHLLVLMEQMGCSIEDMERELALRHK